MSVQSISAGRELGLPLAIPLLPDHASDASLDARWAAWLERGREHDRGVSRKLRITLVGASVIGLLVALVVGVGRLSGLAAGAR